MLYTFLLVGYISPMMHNTKLLAFSINHIVLCQSLTIHCVLCISQMTLHRGGRPKGPKQMDIYTTHVYCTAYITGITVLQCTVRDQGGILTRYRTVHTSRNTALSVKMGLVLSSVMNILLKMGSYLGLE